MSNDTWPAHNMALAVVESMKRHARKPSELYPTPIEGTTAIIPFLGLKAGARILEPACAAGQMSYVLKFFGFDVTSSDLRHTGYGEGGVDFLRDPIQKFMGYDAIVSNPPFDEAERFIRRATAFAPVVALLLKSNYWHAGKRAKKLWDDCTPVAQHPVSWRLAFLKEERGNSPLMDCTWFVWDRSRPKLADRPLIRPTGDQVPPPYEEPLTAYLARLGDAIEDLTASYA